MFWWFLDRLASMGLLVETVDILHAGLSPEHQKSTVLYSISDPPMLTIVPPNWRPMQLLQQQMFMQQDLLKLEGW